MLYFHVLVFFYSYFILKNHLYFIFSSYSVIYFLFFLCLLHNIIHLSHMVVDNGKYWKKWSQKKCILKTLFFSSTSFIQIRWFFSSHVRPSPSSSSSSQSFSRFPIHLYALYYGECWWWWCILCGGRAMCIRPASSEKITTVDGVSCDLLAICAELNLEEARLGFGPSWRLYGSGNEIQKHRQTGCVFSEGMRGYYWTYHANCISLNMYHPSYNQGSMKKHFMSLLNSIHYSGEIFR